MCGASKHESGYEEAVTYIKVYRFQSTTIEYAENTNQVLQRVSKNVLWLYHPSSLPICLSFEQTWNDQCRSSGFRCSSTLAKHNKEFM